MLSRKNQVPKTAIYLLVLCGLILLCFCLLGKETIDFHWYDTYYVLAPSFFYAPLTCFIFGLAAIYFTARNRFADVRLIWGHVLLSVTAVVSFTLVTSFAPLLKPPQSYLQAQAHPGKEINWLFTAETILLLFVFAQLLIIVNLFLGFRSSKQAE